MPGLSDENLERERRLEAVVERIEGIECVPPQVQRREDQEDALGQGGRWVRTQEIVGGQDIKRSGHDILAESGRRSTVDSDRGSRNGVKPSVNTCLKLGLGAPVILSLRALEKARCHHEEGIRGDLTFGFQIGRAHV